MATTIKRVREEGDHGDHVSKKPLSGELIYIMRNKLTSKRFDHLNSLAIKNGLTMTNSYSDKVTHIVTNVPTINRVEDILNTSVPDNVEVVSIDWLTTCFVKGKLVHVADNHRLKRINNEPPPSTSTDDSKINIEITSYECQRPTLLHHHNHHITESLEILEKYYQYKDYKEIDSRPLAFRQASCTMKALPKRVTSIGEVAGLPRIGKHSRKVIEEIILKGRSKEVDDILASDWFKCMELFTSIYGCGPATSDKWYQKGHRTIEDVKENESKLTENQRLGILYYDELSQSICRDEVASITEYVKREINECSDGVSVEPVGGYRRGKLHSHDVDILLSHEKEEITNTLLETVLSHLKKKMILIHADVFTGHNTLAHIQEAHHQSILPIGGDHNKHKRVKFDNLDKAFCILKINRDDSSVAVRRVDIIVVPPAQYPFALLSWTGSKQFNRSIRRYSSNECHKTLTAHGMYDIIENKFLAAKTERDIFGILNLTYLEPWERNC